MLKKYLLRLLLKLYRKEFREITKLTPAEEFKMYLFRDPEEVLRLIKSITTVQVMREFESDSKTEKDMAKGAALILKTIKDAHLQARELNEITDDKEREKLWTDYKRQKKIN